MTNSAADPPHPSCRVCGSTYIAKVFHGHPYCEACVEADLLPLSNALFQELYDKELLDEPPLTNLDWPGRFPTPKKNGRIRNRS